MEVYKIGSAVVRIHGNPDQAKLTEAAQLYLKQIETQRKQENALEVSKSKAK